MTAHLNSSITKKKYITTRRCGDNMDRMASVVFFGSGPVAARSLKLLSSRFTIEAIITKPATISDMRAVHEQASLYAVADKRELNDLFSTTSFYSRLAVLVDFGIIVSELV